MQQPVGAHFHEALGQHVGLKIERNAFSIKPNFPDLVGTVDGSFSSSTAASGTLRLTRGGCQGHDNTTRCAAGGQRPPRTMIGISRAQANSGRIQYTI